MDTMVHRRGRGRRLSAHMLTLALASGAITALAVPADADALTPLVVGPQTTGDAMFPNVGNGGYDARHYDVAISWDADGVVDGVMAGSFASATTRMKAVATKRTALKRFSLDFEGLEVDSVRVNGKPADYRRVQSPEEIKYKLIVTPRKPVKGAFTTVVKYHGVPTAHVDADGSLEGWNATADGATFLGQPIGAMTAYPHNNTPRDKATYTFRVDVPSELTTADGTGPSAVAGNGELIAQRNRGDRTTWVWKQREQMASELAIISIGRYDVLESDVVLADGRVLPEWSFVDVAYSEEDKAAIDARRAELGAIIDRFETIYGRYPGNSVGVVVDIVPDGISYALETQDRSFFPRVRSVTGNTLLHEIVHQWYGDAVSPKVWTDIFINEGMASWGPIWHNLVLAAETPDADAVTEYFRAAYDEVPAEDPAWSIAPGAQTDPAMIYDFQTYDRGAMFYEALRLTVGDEAFFGIVKRWQRLYSGESQGRAAFKRLAEKVSGQDLDVFWQDWILDTDKPEWPTP
ncbi:M1 family metallopeptidase [Nocardioides ferulae]|uniref:M1 family metallopeptidase n=1 Tax=Nocardioides ferulae TaxID=2340821 RepID=UPI000EAB802F|nr:M1 family metallopeptidase [Nocardioides ferulae]